MMRIVKIILLFYILIMSILGIWVMKPITFIGLILSVLWIGSIVGLYLIKPKQK